jgi:hypothetical protein
VLGFAEWRRHPAVRQGHLELWDMTRAETYALSSGYAKHDDARLAELAAELVGLKVHVIVYSVTNEPYRPP